jgi:hypothetical protein
MTIKWGGGWKQRCRNFLSHFVFGNIVNSSVDENTSIKSIAKFSWYAEFWCRSSLKVVARETKKEMRG